MLQSMAKEHVKDGYLAGKQGLPDPKLPTHFYFRNLPITLLDKVSPRVAKVVIS